MTAGPVDLTVTFLSPVEVCPVSSEQKSSLLMVIQQPKDLVKQSLPLSYLSINASSTDGSNHDVQIYTDISAEWISGDDNLVANWTTSVGNIITHQVQLAEQTVFKEVSDHIQRRRLISVS